MKKFRIGTTYLVLVMLFASNALAEKMALIVIPNTKEGVSHITEAGEYCESVEKVLKAEKIKVAYFYTPIEDQPGDAAKRNLAQKAIPQILRKKPDVLILWSDTAAKYVGTEIDSIPIVFGYVFGTLESVNMPKPNATGVIRRSFAPDIWGLAASLFGAKTVAMLSKNNVPMAGIREVLLSKADGLEKLSGVRLQEMYLCDTFAQWQERVKNFKADFIYTADISRLLRADGTEMPQGETMKWTVEHSSVPVVAGEGVGVEYGALYTILVSPKAWGIQTGQMVLKILNGTPIKDLPVETVKKGALIINAKTALKYKMDIPYDILSSAEKVIE